MGFIQLKGIDEVQELELAPEGEYSLSITDAEYYTNDSGRGVIRCRIEFEDHDNFSGFNHWVALPDNELDNPDNDDKGQEKMTRMMRGVKRFLHLWGVEPGADGFDPADLNGASAMANVGQTTNDETGDVFNDLRVPRIRD